MSNYRNRRNYENLERRIFDGVGEYGIPEIQSTPYEGGCVLTASRRAAPWQYRPWA